MKIIKDIFLTRIELTPKEYKKLGFSHKELLMIANDGFKENIKRSYFLIELMFITLILAIFAINVGLVLLAVYFGVIGTIMQYKNCIRYHKWRNEILKDKFKRVSKC